MLTGIFLPNFGFNLQRRSADECLAGECTGTAEDAGGATASERGLLIRHTLWATHRNVIDDKWLKFML